MVNLECFNAEQIMILFFLKILFALYDIELYLAIIVGEDLVLDFSTTGILCLGTFSKRKKQGDIYCFVPNCREDGQITTLGKKT